MLNLVDMRTLGMKVLPGLAIAVGLVVLLGSCKRDDDAEAVCDSNSTPLCAQSEHSATPYKLLIPEFFPDPIIPADNPLTEEGVELGRFLFWEKKLSRNNAVSCGSCHFPQASFSDNAQFSTGLYGDQTDRNSMALVNLAWVNSGFFWDGRALTLEEQILEPIEHPIEMDLTWREAVERLAEDPNYQDMFAAAFGSPCVDSVRTVKALAQFIRTMVSHRSKFDKSRYYGEALLSPEENRGLLLFLAEGGDPNFVAGGQGGGDCFHCHGDIILFTDNLFRNNGLDSEFSDLGRANVTGNEWDRGLFRTPTLRNIALTAPYMHDGRFATLMEVIEHYDFGGHPSPTIDPLMKLQGIGLSLSPQDKSDLVAFLETLTDYEFVENEKFHDPH